MKHLTILVPEGENNLSSIAGAYKIFSRANKFWKEVKGSPLFKIELAGTAAKIGFYDDLFTVRPHKNISAIAKTHLVIIPSLNHNYQQALMENEKIIGWIAAQYAKGAAVASICTGAFLLAATGLLEGKSCSTHWSAAEDFKLNFPGVSVKPDQLITDENDIYTNGGAYSFLQLIIYLVEKYFDRRTAVYCAKVFQIDMDRNTQSPFVIFNGHKKHDDEMILKAQQYIEKNYQEKISMENLSVKLHSHRRSFDRRFIKATGITPLDYLQRVKIEAAKKSLENTRKSVSEIMYEVGYSDPKAFRDVFSKVTGMTPLIYKSKYNKEKS